MMEPVSERWTRCKELLKHRLDEEDAATWLPPLELASLSPGKAVFHGIPNTFFKNRIQARFAPLVRECLAEAFGAPPLGEDLALDLRVGGAPSREISLHQPQVGGPAEFPGAVYPEVDPLPPEASQSAYGGAGAPVRPGVPGSAEFSFADCIEGEANAAALKLSRQVADAPGARYNPFYLVGGVGLGKSHLLRVIAAEVSRAEPSLRVVYRTAEAFTNDVLDGIRRKRMPAVREVYRTADLLLVDDVQFLQVSERSQQELLHTFDALHGAHKQVVFSADRFPAELGRLEPTLRSRMEMGLAAEIAPPNSKMRLAFLMAKARSNGLELPPESAQLLAQKITSGFRQLEGALVRVAAYAALHGEAATPAFVARVAEPFFEEEPEPPGLPVSEEIVLGRVCDHFGLAMKTLRSRGRTAHLAKARRVAVYLLRETGGLSFPEVGAALGNRSHSTIIHAMRVVQKELDSDPAFRKAVFRLRCSLAGGKGKPA